MKAKLKAMYSADSDTEALENYSPEHPDNFCILFRAMVGPEDMLGSANLSKTPRPDRGAFQLRCCLLAASKTQRTHD